MPTVKPKIAKKQFAPFVPPIVSWIVTGRCNMCCVHCYPASGPEYAGPELSFEEQAAVVPKLAEAQVESVFLSGGETLMLPRLFDLVDLLKEHDLRVWLCTNGSLLDEAMAQRMARAKLVGVSVSLDSGDPSTHDQFRAHPGAHAKARRAIELLRKHDVIVNVDYTATEVNRSDLAALYQTASELGAKSIFLKRFRPLGRGLENAQQLALSLDDYRDTIAKLLDVYNGTGTEICFEDPAVYAQFRKEGSDGKVRTDGLYALCGCLAGAAWLGLQPNGDITPCPLLNVPIGHILRDDLRAVVESSELLRRMLDRDDRGGRCGTCDERWACGGCRAHAYAESGDCFAEDPFCIYTP